MNKERLTQLAETLLEIPERIAEKQGMVLDYNEQIQSISNEITQIESVIKSEINAQVDDNGKKLYSNVTRTATRKLFLSRLISSRCPTRLNCTIDNCCMQ